MTVVSLLRLRLLAARTNVVIFPSATREGFPAAVPFLVLVQGACARQSRPRAVP